MPRLTHHSVLVLCVLFAAAFAAGVVDAFPPPSSANVDHQLFHRFQQTYNLSYAHAAEEASRFSIFKSNLEIVERLNHEHVRIGGGRVFGISKFMDLTPIEFSARYLNHAEIPNELPEAPSKYVPSSIKSTDIPTSFDWSSKGVITPVKNQEQCGSCWAFSATETIESAWAIAGNPISELAPQQIVDCDAADYGCGGGWPYNAYQYVIHAPGQELESSYPYTAVDGTCAFNQSLVAAKISTWQWVSQDPSTETTKMLDFVANQGPLSVCVDASSWQYYTGGVLKQCTNQVDHCVQVTGFQNMNGLDVWNVRNSWGAWGDNNTGYIYIERGMNLCLIASYATSASV